jgi:hypothetical protein
MDPKWWGPHCWFFIHSVILGYSDNPTEADKQNFKQFFESLGKVLPCNKCRNNYKQHLMKLPLDDSVLSSRDKLVKWLIDVHNEVNVATQKSPVSYETAIEAFTTTPNQDIGIATLMIIVIIIIFIIMLPYIIIRFLG